MCKGCKVLLEWDFGGFVCCYVVVYVSVFVELELVFGDFFVGIWWFVVLLDWRV